MEKEILDELLKRRGNKRHNFRVWNAFMEDSFGIKLETVKKEGMAKCVS